MRSRPALLASLIAVALVAVVGTVGWRWYSTERDREAGSKAALAAYVKGWNAKTMTGVSFDTPWGCRGLHQDRRRMATAPVSANAESLARDGRRRPPG